MYSFNYAGFANTSQNQDPNLQAGANLHAANPGSGAEAKARVVAAAKSCAAQLQQQGNTYHSQGKYEQAAEMYKQVHACSMIQR